MSWDEWSGRSGVMSAKSEEAGLGGGGFLLYFIFCFME